MPIPILFLIKPVSLEAGFELSSAPPFARPSSHPRLFDAILHAVEMQAGAPARIQIFDCDGRLADTLRLPARQPAARSCPLGKG